MSLDHLDLLSFRGLGPSHFALVGQAVPAEEILKKVMNCYELL
jgi:hypothetical protein